MRILIAIVLVYATSITKAVNLYCQNQNYARQDTGVIQNLYRGVSDSLFKNKQFLSFFDLNEFSKNNKKELHTNIQIETFYAGGQSISLFGAGLFSNISINESIIVLGAPILVSGNIVMQQNHINRRLSGVSLQFDYATFIKKYREKLCAQALQNHIKSLGVAEKEAFLTRIELNNLQLIVMDSSFQQKRAILQRRLDSLSMHGEVNTDSNAQIDSLTKIKKSLDKVNNRIDSLYRRSLEQEALIQATLAGWKRKFNEIQDAIEGQEIQSDLLPFDGNLGMKNKVYSFLRSINRFQVGSFQMNSSPYDIASIPLNGFSTELRHSGYYYALTYGVEGRQDRRLPDYVWNYRLNGNGRHVFQTKIGIGYPESSHIHLSVSNIRMSAGTIDSMSTFPRRNLLLNLDGRYLIGDGMFIDLVAGLSNSDFTGSTRTKQLLEGMYSQHESVDNFAGLIRFGWRSLSGNNEFSIGYQQVGVNYITLGNLFLLNNRNLFRFETRSRFLKSKGQIKLCYLFGSSLTSTDVYPGIRQQQIAGELSYRLGKHGSRVWVKYNPSFYLQQGSGSKSTITQLNLTSAGIQVVYPSRTEGKWMSFMQLTNFQDQTQFGDTGIVSGLWYGYVSQYFQVKRYSCSLGVNPGFDFKKSTALKDLNGELSQSYEFKFISIQQGVQIVKRFYDSAWYAGGMLGIRSHTKNRLSLGAGFRYLWALKPAEKDQFYLNSNISWVF